MKKVPLISPCDSNARYLEGDTGTNRNIGSRGSDEASDVRDLVAMIEVSHLGEEIVIAWDITWDMLCLIARSR